MLNRNAKGQRLERKCELELMGKGYKTWKTIRNRFQNIDLWGLFDVAGLHYRGRDIRLIQVKSNRCDTDTRNAIKDLRVPKGVIKEIWIWKDKVGWEKEVYE